MPLGSGTAPITLAEDLILLKMAFHREKDILDVRSMIWNRKRELDLAYIRRWAGKMLSEERVSELEGWIRRYGGR